jgi:hypothetical protein
MDFKMVAPSFVTVISPVEADCNILSFESEMSGSKTYHALGTKGAFDEISYGNGPYKRGLNSENAV